MKAYVVVWTNENSDLHWEEFADLASAQYFIHSSNNKMLLFTIGPYEPGGFTVEDHT
jgi:hypothetical protein